jgi:hypothetical protein
MATAPEHRSTVGRVPAQQLTLIALVAELEFPWAAQPRWDRVPAFRRRLHAPPLEVSLSTIPLAKEVKLTGIYDQITYG